MANNVMFNGRATLRITKSGRIDRRSKVGAVIQQLIDNKVDEALKKNGVIPESQGQIKEPTPDDVARKRRNARNKWITSQMGRAMSIAQGVSVGIRYNNAEASGDEAKQYRTLLSGGTSAVTLALGTFGGIWGMVASTIIAYSRGLVGQYFENSIQSKYDSKRLQYRLTNYDISKYSTQVYDYGSQKFRAVDTDRINRNILGNVNIS